MPSSKIPASHVPLHTGENPLFGRTMFFLGHVGMIFGFHEFYKLGFSWQSLAIFVAGFFYDHLGGLGITAGAHRLWSHRSYEANSLYRFIVMLFNCIAFQGELLYWCKDHRVHHHYSDTRKDPHNATRGFWYSHMGWLLMARDPECAQALREQPVADLLKDWVIIFQLKYYPVLVLIMRVIIPTLIGYTITGSWRVGLYINCCGFWCQSLHHTFLVNSAAHMVEWGYQPYDPTMRPSENIVVVYAALGEGHHNFHHVYPKDYATSELDWTATYNPTKWFIDTAAKLGMIKWRKRYLSDGKKNNKFVAKTIKGNARTL